MKRMTRVSQTDRTIPALPNAFPYNELLFRGILRLGHYAVKTRSWQWKHRGLVLLYTSLSTHEVAVDAYGFDPKTSPRRAIVGAGNLVDVRPLSDDEKHQLLLQFNNATPEEAAEFGQYGGPAYIAPLEIGFFFSNLKRFEKPVSFKAPQGAISVFRVPVSTVAIELKKVGMNV